MPSPNLSHTHFKNHVRRKLLEAHWSSHHRNQLEATLFGAPGTAERKTLLTRHEVNTRLKEVLERPSHHGFTPGHIDALREHLGEYLT